MDAGAPGDQYADLRVAWLSTDPDRLAEDRLRDGARGVVIAGASAARLHGIGDLPAARHDFVSPKRRQSQRPEIRYRQRNLDPRDVTLVEGLPVMTVERTIADLVEDVKELSLVADVLRDASERRSPDTDRLEELLAPLAERNGLPKADGRALLNRLMELAGIDLKTIAREIASTPGLGPLVAADLAARLPWVEFAELMITPEIENSLQAIGDAFTKNLLDALAQVEQLNLAAYTDLTSTIQNSLKNVVAPNIAALAIGGAIGSFSKDWTPLEIDPVLPTDLMPLIRTTRETAHGV